MSRGDTYRYVACDKCDYSQTLWVRGKVDSFAESIYCFNEGRIAPVLKNKWWCHQCKSIKDVENIPSVEEVNEYLTNIEVALSDERTCRFLGEPTLKYYQQILGNVDTWFEWAKTRKNPRCLTCGCQELTPLSQEIIKGKTMGKLGVIHPNCGGDLYVGEGEMAIRASWPRKSNTAPVEYYRFTSDGLRMKKEHDIENKPSSRKGPSALAWMVLTVAAITLFYFSG